MVERKPKPLWLGAVFVAIGLAILLTLGFWQLQRLKWKEGLLAHMAALQSAPARPLEAALAGREPDFVRVSFDCPDLLTRPRERVYSVQDGAIVYKQVVACPISPSQARSILVDIGYEDCEWEKPIPPFSGPLVGILRKPDRKNFVTPPNQPSAKLWYWRDLPAMAKALRAEPTAPVFVALERGPQPTGSCHLTRTALPTDIPNRHLEYALTWFGLAAALAGVYIAMLLRRRSS